MFETAAPAMLAVLFLGGLALRERLVEVLAGLDDDETTDWPQD